MIGLPVDGLGSFVEFQKWLLEFVNLSIIFEDKHLVLFGDGLYWPLDFGCIFSIVVDGLKEGGQGCHILLVDILKVL